MTGQEIQALGSAFAVELQAYRGRFQQDRTAKHFDTYCRGAARRPAAEEHRADCAGRRDRGPHPPGVPVTAGWDHDARGRLQRRVAAGADGLPGGNLGTVGVIDETSCAKKGDKTPGVQRQYLGCAGKIDHGIVTVHVGLARGDVRARLDAELYLLRSSADDRPRCRAVTSRTPPGTARSGGSPWTVVALQSGGVIQSDEVPECSDVVVGDVENDNVLRTSRVHRGRRVHQNRSTWLVNPTSFPAAVYRAAGTTARYSAGRAAHNRRAVASVRSPATLPTTCQVSASRATPPRLPPTTLQSSSASITSRLNFWGGGPATWAITRRVWWLGVPPPIGRAKYECPRVSGFTRPATGVSLTVVRPRADVDRMADG
jgi:hypothetical protein